jgi:hypothetical protein
LPGYPHHRLQGCWAQGTQNYLHPRCCPCLVNKHCWQPCHLFLLTTLTSDCPDILAKPKFFIIESNIFVIIKIMKHIITQWIKYMKIYIIYVPFKF